MAWARSCDSWILLFWTIFSRIDFISPMFLVEVAFSAAASSMTEGSGLTLRKNVSTPPRLRSRWALEWMETNRSARFWLAMTVRSSSPTSTSDSRVRTASMPALSLSSLRRARATARLISFSWSPLLPIVPGLGPPWPGSMTTVRTPSPSWRARDVPLRFGSFGSTWRLTAGWTLSPGRGGFSAGDLGLGRRGGRSVRVDVDDQPVGVEEVDRPGRTGSREKSTSTTSRTVEAVFWEIRIWLT